MALPNKLRRRISITVEYMSRIRVLRHNLELITHGGRSYVHRAREESESKGGVVYISICVSRVRRVYFCCGIFNKDHSFCEHIDVPS